MDWLQFTASAITSVAGLIGSLAWPGVVAFLIYLLRPQLASMAQRLTELSLPGGGKATFQTALASAANTVIALEATDIPVSTKPPEDLPPTVLIATPADRISSKFWEVENIIRQKISFLPLEQKKIPADFVYYDLAIDGRGEIYKLYNKIRNLFMSASDAAPGDISEADAQKYEVICNAFLERFEREYYSWRASYENSKAPISEEFLSSERP